MDPIVIRLHPQAPPKPRENAPCNGCGVCCAAEPCPVGLLVTRRRRGPCRALLWIDNECRYRCGMVLEPARLLPWLPRWAQPLWRRLALRWIAAAKGCDCDWATLT